MPVPAELQEKQLQVDIQMAQEAITSTVFAEYPHLPAAKGL